MDFPLANYHTHTTRCMHARGTEEEYIQTAMDAGFCALGFADHTPWPYRSDFVANMRMHISQLDDYVSAIRALQAQYAGRIRLHLGLECEAFPEFFPWLRELLDQSTVDYLILGNHYDTSDERGGLYFGRCSRSRQLGRYMDTTIAGMQSGLFTYLAHPDLALAQYPRFDSDAKQVCRAICEEAKRLSLPLEYNLLGERRLAEYKRFGAIGYTSPQFWEIAAETGCRAIIGVDAHAPQDLNRDCAAKFVRVRRTLSDMGIEVMDQIDALEGKGRG